MYIAAEMSREFKTSILKYLIANGKWQLYKAYNSDKSSIAVLGNSVQFPKLSSY